MRQYLGEPSRSAPASAWSEHLGYAADRCSVVSGCETSQRTRTHTHKQDETTDAADDEMITMGNHGYKSLGKFGCTGTSDNDDYDGDDDDVDIGSDLL